MRWWLAALVLAFSCLCAQAAEPRKYAVLSLIGDRLLVVQRSPATEQQAERNARDFLMLEDAVFDQTALLYAEQALKRAEPKAGTVLLKAQDPSLYFAAERVLDAGSDTAQILEPLKPVLSGSGATHLVLFTKLRHEAMLQTDRGHLGSGPLEGLGFYIDRTRPLIRSDTGEAAFGFLGPFAYFQITLFDLQRGRVLKQQQVTATRTLSAARSKEGDPWATLSSRQKIAVLQELIRVETARMMPILLGSF